MAKPVFVAYKMFRVSSCPTSRHHITINRLLVSVDRTLDLV
jgi:hypothetical protein